MRRIAQGALGARESLGREPLPVEHVDQVEVHGELAIRDRGDAADDDVIGAAAPPVRDEHVLAASRLDGHLPARQRPASRACCRASASRLMRLRSSETPASIERVE